MNLDEAAEYWKLRLSQNKPIYRVRVRRLLELAGAERRGWAIMRRIGDTLGSYGLETQPDFRSAWIDGLVSIRLQGNLGKETDSEAEDGSAEPGDPLSEEINPVDDPCAESNQAENETFEPLAEVLLSSGGDAGVVETPIASAPEPDGIAGEPIDPVRRISSIASANKGVLSVLLTDSLQVATTRMMFEGYSQLAVMQGQRNVRGMISWESIAKRSMLSPEPALVSDCRVDAQVIESDGSLFDALPTIEKFGYVLVRAKGTITGIVTASDIAVELRSLSYAFVSIGTIEGLIRRKLHPKLANSDLALLEEKSKAREENDVASMTFGENVRLLERDDIWERLALNVDKKHFIKKLLLVRDIRNDVMHFNPDPLGPNQKRELEQMEEFLRQVFC